MRTLKNKSTLTMDHGTKMNDGTTTRHGSVRTTLTGRTTDGQTLRTGPGRMK